MYFMFHYKASNPVNETTKYGQHLNILVYVCVCVCRAGGDFVGMEG